MTTIDTQTIEDFLSHLASKQPAPGGGTVAGLVSALSASLGSMVLAYSKGKEAYGAYASLHEKCAVSLEIAREESISLADADAEAYKALQALWKLPKDSPKREKRWDAVVEAAIFVPLRTMELCNRVLVTLQELVGKTNTMLTSDLAIGAILAQASCKAAYMNVRINLPLVRSESMWEEYAKKAEAMRDACDKIAISIETSCKV